VFKSLEKHVYASFDILIMEKTILIRQTNLIPKCVFQPVCSVKTSFSVHEIVTGDEKVADEVLAMGNICR